MNTEFNLLLVRHGIAEELADLDGNGTDAARALSPQGARRTRAGAKGLRHLGFKATWLCSSSLVRAVETAQLLAKPLRAGAPLFTTESLAPDAEPGALMDALLARDGGPPDKSTVVCVGHGDQIDRVLAQITGGVGAAPLGKAGAAVVLVTVERFEGVDPRHSEAPPEEPSGPPGGDDAPALAVDAAASEESPPVEASTRGRGRRRTQAPAARPNPPVVEPLPPQEPPPPKVSGRLVAFYPPKALRVLGRG